MTPRYALSSSPQAFAFYVLLTQIQRTCREEYAQREKQQERAAEMKPDDCIIIPVGVKHWHSAAPGRWFSRGKKTSEIG